MEPSVAISCSTPRSPPSIRDKRNRCTLVLSTVVITRLRPLGSAITPSPERIRLGSPPADGTDQIFPAAEKYSVFPSGEEATDEISPLAVGILIVTRPVAVSA